LLHRLTPVVVVVVTSLVVTTLLALLVSARQANCNMVWTGYWLSNGLVPYSTPYAAARIAAVLGRDGKTLAVVGCGGYTLRTSGR